MQVLLRRLVVLVVVERPRINVILIGLAWNLPATNEVVAFLLFVIRNHRSSRWFDFRFGFHPVGLHQQHYW